MTIQGRRLLLKCRIAALSPFATRMRSVAACLTVVLILAGCGVTTTMRSMFGGELPFYVTVAPDANENSAVAVDLLVVYDEKVLEQLLKMPAAEWFTRKPQFVADYGDQLLVKGWEWIPSQVVEKQIVEYRAGARKVIVFADYASVGDHRAAIDPQQPFHLTLDTLDLNVKVAR